MKLPFIVTFILFTSNANAENNGTFPRDFLFGVGGSAYQIEGAWNEDAKGENIWDRWVHDNVPHIKNNDTGDITCDSYHRYSSDVFLAGYMLGAQFYEFSISWSRILPTGFENRINLKAIMYYQELINEIILSGMIPVATLYHNDLPQPLQDLGGWTNPEMEKYFVNYARVVFQYFNKVTNWITFNEPKSTCRLGYGEGIYAPGISLDGSADYLCAYTLLKSHAAVYHMYKDEFPKLGGNISMAIDFEWSEPASNSIADIEAAERRNMFEFGIYANPIFAGNWPQVVIDRVGNRSQNENSPKSRLPVFTQEEIDYIKGTSKFMGVNLRYTNLVKDIPEPEFSEPGYMKDLRAEISVDPDWELSSSGHAIVPWGARKSLQWLKNTYNDPLVFITGNGVSDDGSSTVDDVRINFYRDYLSAILDAMYEDNVRVFAYAAWSLLDSFEWSEGYRQHYGFYQVNMTDVARRRIQKSSVSFYSDLTYSYRIPAGKTTSTTTTTTAITPTTTDAADRAIFYPMLISFSMLLSYLLH